MLIYKQGDILKSTENIICHQVNENGIMGGGLALQIATQYPYVLDEIQKYLETVNGVSQMVYEMPKE